MDLILNSNVMESNTGIADILIDSINKKWDNVRDFSSIIVNLQDENYDDMIPVIESILEDENKNIGRLQQLVELISPNSEAIDDGKQEAIDILDDNNSVVEGSEMKLSENFSNVVDKTTTVISPVLAKSIEEHDANKKKYDDAIKENQKIADETVPKEGDTGKKVKSSDLKKMKLSEELFGGSLNEEVYAVHDGWEISDDADEVLGKLEDAIYEIRNGRRGVATRAQTPEQLCDYMNTLADALKDCFYTDYEDANESLEEKFNKSCNESYYPSVVKKIAKKVLKEIDSDNIFSDKAISCMQHMGLNDSQINDVQEYVCNSNKSYTESLKYKVAKEQLQRFNESKMPKSWTPEKYINKLVEKKHLTESEGRALLTESVTDINNFRKVLARILYNLKEAHEDLDPKADRFDIAATIVNGSLHELQQLDKALQTYRDGE